MNNYARHLFRRGFLLTDIKVLVFKDKLSQQTIDKWSTVSFGKYQLHFDNDMPSVVLEDKGYRIALLGLVLNPFDKLNNKNHIAGKLLKKKQESEEVFLNYVDELSGRFVIISQTPEITEVYHDACGTRTVYYDCLGEGTVISSHSTLIADLLDYKASKRSFELLTHKEYGGRRYLPGLLSPYEGVKPLIPNTKYQVEKRTVKRIFPRGPIEPIHSVDELVDELVAIMQTQAELLYENNKISVSLTAGLDSRLTYAMQSKIDGDVDYFTHISVSNPRKFREDIKIAKKLADIKKAPYKVYEYSTNNDQPELMDFRRVWQKNVGMYRGSMHLFKMYADQFPKDRVHIRSNIAEIARVFYSNRSEELNAEELAKLYTTTKMNEHPAVIESFQDFIETNHFSKENFYNYEYADLFYWEHRMPMWHSWILLESDVAYESFVPYNNRILLTKMLSAPYEERESGTLFTKMIHKVWPELLELPVNKIVMG
ncbi:MAG: hypothetical protein ACQEWI_15355 [Bacillota bacterium]